MTHDTAILDGNKAAASVACRLNEVIAIYPITPASPMGEWAGPWKEEKRRNIWCGACRHRYLSGDHDPHRPRTIAKSAALPFHELS